MPREGEDMDDILITVTPALHPPEPTIPQHWQSLLTTLAKLHGEGTKSNSIKYLYLNYKIQLYTRTRTYDVQQFLNILGLYWNFIFWKIPGKPLKFQVWPRIYYFFILKKIT